MLAHSTRNASRAAMSRASQRVVFPMSHSKPASPPLQFAPTFAPPRRALGIMSTVNGKIMDRNKKAGEDAFKDQLAKMLSGPPYTLSSWNDELTEAMSSWRMSVPGAKSQPEVVKIMAYQEILAKMSPELKANPAPLLKDERKMAALAADSGKTKDDIRNMMTRFEALKVCQQWVQKRRADGKSLPKSMEDMQMLVQVDMQKKKVAQARSRSRRF